MRHKDDIWPDSATISVDSYQRREIVLYRRRPAKNEMVHCEHTGTTNRKINKPYLVQADSENITENKISPPCCF
jgi:hypothetical protein